MKNCIFKKLSFLLLLVAILYPLPLIAKDRNINLGISGGWLSSKESPDSLFGRTSLGINLSNYIALDLSILNTFSQKGSTFISLDSSLYLFPESKVSPFFVIGAGAGIIEREDRTSTKAFFNGGAGLQYFFSGGTALRFDLRNYIVSGQTDLAASAGIVFYFDPAYKPQPVQTPEKEQAKEPLPQQERLIVVRAKDQALSKSAETGIIKTQPEKSILPSEEPQKKEFVGEVKEQRPSEEEKTDTLLKESGDTIKLEDLVREEKPPVLAEVAVSETIEKKEIGKAEKGYVEKSHGGSEENRDIQKVVRGSADSKEKKIEREKTEKAESNISFERQAASLETQSPELSVIDKSKEKTIAQEDKAEEVFTRGAPEKDPGMVSPQASEKAVEISERPAMEKEQEVQKAVVSKEVESDRKGYRPAAKDISPVERTHEKEAEKETSYIIVSKKLATEKKGDMRIKKQRVYERAKMYGEVSAEISADKVETEIERAAEKDQSLEEGPSGEKKDFLETNIEFDLRETELGQLNREILLRLVKELKEKGYRKLIIEGHACAHGNRKTNLLISKKRALAVRDFLKKHGIMRNITIKYYGEDRLRFKENPTPDNINDPHVKANRRVRIIAYR